jgi:hypothetical protein
MVEGKTMIIKDFITVLKTGEELKNPANWKKGQVLTNTVGGLVMAAVAIIKWKFPDIEIPQVVADYAIEIISGALVVANAYMTTASTKKIGVK